MSEALDDLRGSLIGLLVLQHVGGLLIEIHARDALLRALGAIQGALLRGGAVLRLAGLNADRAHIALHARR